ncbi:MAG: nitroreductase family protein [Clostridia bacterium]|nr:nitroreductase family protein [Clostridia bacterium]
MNREVYNTILARRSIRSFAEQKVSREDVRTLLEAGMAAPSACNLQPWTFIVVDDGERLAALRDCAKLGRYNAPLAIIVCGTARHIPWKGEGWLFDIGACAENIMLECVELGLASVCIGGFDAARLSEAFGIPEDVRPVCILEIGYPAWERQPISWYDEAAVHWQTYDATRERSMRTMEDLHRDMASGLL